MVGTNAGVNLEAFEADSQAGSYRSRYDPEVMPTSMAVIATISRGTERSPFDIGPLETHVNTDALDAFFRDAEKMTNDSELTFSVPDYTVTVRTGGDIDVHRSGDTRGTTGMDATDDG